MGILDSLIHSESELLEQRQSKFMKLDSAFAQLDSAYKSLEQKYPLGIPDDIKQGQEAMRIMLDQSRKRLESRVAATPKTRGMLSFMKQEVPKLPEYATKLAGQAGEAISGAGETIKGGLEQLPEPIKDYYKTTFGKGMVEPVMTIAGGVQEMAAATARNLDAWASWLSDMTGIPKDGFLGKDALKVAENEFMALSDTFLKHGMNPDESWMAALQFHTYNGIGRLAFDLPIIMRMGLPIHGAVTGGGAAVQANQEIARELESAKMVMENPDNYDENTVKWAETTVGRDLKPASVAMGTIVGGIEGLLLHGALKSARFLPQPEKMLFGAGIFGSPAVVQEMSKPPGERDYSYIVAETLLGAGLLYGRKAGISRKQLVRDLKNQFGKDYDRLTEQFGKMADDKMLDEFARGRGATIANLASTPQGNEFVRNMRPFETFQQARWRYLHEKITKRGAEDVLRKEVEAGRAAAEQQAQQEALAFRRRMAGKKIEARVREKEQLEKEQQYLSDLEKRAEFDDAYLRQVGKENARMNELDDMNIALMTKHQEFYDQMEVILKRAAIPKKVYEGAPELVKAGKPEFISEELGIERPTSEILKTQGEIEEIMIRVNQVKKQYEGEIPIVGEGGKSAGKIPSDKEVRKEAEPELQRERGGEARREDLQRVEEAKRAEPAPLKTELVEEALRVQEESKGKQADESLTGRGYELGIKARTDSELAKRIEQGIEEMDKYIETLRHPKTDKDLQISSDASIAKQYFTEAKQAAETTEGFKVAVEKGEVDVTTGKYIPKAEHKAKEPKGVLSPETSSGLVGVAYDIRAGKEVIDIEKLNLELDRIEHNITKGKFDLKDLNQTELYKLGYTNYGAVKIAFKENPSAALEKIKSEITKKPIETKPPPEKPIRAGFEGGVVYEKVAGKWRQIEKDGKPTDVEITDRTSIKNIENMIGDVKTKAEKDAIAEKMIKEAEKKKPAKPGKEPENIRQMVKSMGKIKSSDLAEHGISIKEDRNLFMQIGNKKGRPLDDLAQTLIKSKDNPEGVLPPTPKDMNPTDWLIENIRKNTKIIEEKVTEKKYDKEFLDFQYREMDISTISKEKFAELMDKNKEPENISTDKLNKGDSFTIAGEKFKVTKETEDRMRIEDGQEYELDRQFDFITIDKGSLVKAGEIPKTVFSYNVVVKSQSGGPKVIDLEDGRRIGIGSGGDIVLSGVDKDVVIGKSNLTASTWDKKGLGKKELDQIEEYLKIRQITKKPVAKEPWQMTLAEYRGETAYQETAKREHEASIINALREGKELSKEVAEDYPDLIAKYEKEFAAKKAKEGIDLTKPGEQAQREAREKRIEEGDGDLFTEEQRKRQKDLFASEGPDLVKELKPVYANKEYPTSDLNQPITLRQIGEKLSRDINYEETKDVRFGMIKRFSRKAKGLYFPDSGIIRVRNIRDIGVLAHEIGHLLDKGIFGIEAKFKYDKSDFVINSSFGIKDPARREKRLAKLKEKYGNELVDSLFERYELRQELKKLLTVTGYPSKEYGEAIAEFVKYYVKDPKFARDTAPKFNNLFESILDQDPNLRQALLTARRNYSRYEEQSALQKMKSTIARDDEHGRVFNAIKRFKDDFYVNFIDAMAPIETIDKELLKRDPSISVIKRPLTQALSALGVDGKAEQFLNFRPFLKEGDEIKFSNIRPLIGNRNQKGIIYDIITKGLIEDFEGYLVANRNVVLHKRGLPGAATERLSESKNAIKEAETQWPWFKGLAKELQDYQDSLLKYYLKSGKLSQEQYDHIKELNPFYIPFQRYFAEYESSGNFPGVSRYLKDSAPSPVKRIGKESFREVVSPLGSMIKNTYDLISAADKNDALNSIVFALEKIDKRLVQDIPKRMVKPVMVFPKEGEGMELRFTVTYDKPKNAEIVSVWQDGEVHYKQIPKKYYDALFYNQQPLGRFVKVLAWPAKILRAGAVIFDPTFAVRNVPRDQLSGWFYSRYNYNPFHFVKGLSEFTGKSDLYQKFLASGADQSFLTMIDKEMSKGYIEKKAGKKIQTKWQEYKSNPWIFFADINRASEMGTRMGSFRNAYIKTGNVYKAMEEARQISADYGIKGRWMRNVAAIYPFLNARTQHAKMMNKSAIRRGAGSFIAKGLPLVAASTMQWLINNSDDRVRLLYNELPPWRRIGMYNFHIPYTDSFWSLPRGPLGLLFGATTEYALDKMAGYDAELIGNIAEEFFKDYLPMSNWTDIVPQAGRPLVEQYANKVGYTGRPIVRKKLKGLEPVEQYEAWTSEIMKSLGNVLDIPPVRLQHLFVAYTAGTGRYILNISDDLLEVAGLTEPSGEDTFTKLSRWPITKAFISKPALGARGRSVHKFYETLDRIETVNRTVNNFLKDENVARADSYLKDEENDKAYKYYANPENRRSMGRFREVLRDAKFLRKEIIEGDYKNKREKMIALDEALTKTAIRFNNAYRDNKVFTVDEIMNEIRAIGRQARGEEKQIIRQFKNEFQSEKQLESAMSRMQLYKLRQKAGTLPAIDKYRMEALQRKLKRYNEQTQ